MENAKNSLVPPITTPVRDLKESFTLQGEPLKISECMRKMRWEILRGDEADEIICEVSRDGGQNWHQFIFNSTSRTWSYGTYKINQIGFCVDPIPEKDVISFLLKHYYAAFGVFNPIPRVSESLFARLKPIMPEAEVCALRKEIMHSNDPR